MRHRSEVAPGFRTFLACLTCWTSASPKATRAAVSPTRASTWPCLARSRAWTPSSEAWRVPVKLGSVQLCRSEQHGGFPNIGVLFLPGPLLRGFDSIWGIQGVPLFSGNAQVFEVSTRSLFQLVKPKTPEALPLHRIPWPLVHANPQPLSPKAHIRPPAHS